MEKKKPRLEDLDNGNIECETIKKIKELACVVDLM